MNTWDEASREYYDALRAGNAGVVEVEPPDDPAEVEAQLRSAAEALGIPIVVGWLGGRRDMLAWRRWDGSTDDVLLGIRPQEDPPAT